jgi:hypothetical protein
MEQGMDQQHHTAQSSDPDRRWLVMLIAALNGDAPIDGLRPVLDAAIVAELHRQLAGPAMPGRIHGRLN